MRAVLYPGRSVWTEEGSTFAWRMMLRDKRGGLHFLVRNRAERTARRVNVEPYVTAWQRRSLIATPDLMLQFAHWLVARERATAPGAANADRIEVRAVTKVRLNGRSPRPIVNPRVDLARERRRIGHYPWIMPLGD
jgi:hypothetical protein